MRLSVGLILGLAVSVYIFAADWSVSHTLPLRVFDFAGRDILYSEINATDSVFIGTYSAETRQIVNQKLILHLAGSEQIKDCVFWRSNRERTKKVFCLSDEQLFIIGLTSRGYELERSVSLDYNPKPSSVNWSYSLINAALEGRPHEGIRQGDRVPKLMRIKSARRVYVGDVDNDGENNILISRSIGAIRDLVYHYLDVFAYENGELRLLNSIIFAGSGDEGIIIFDFDGDGLNELLVPSAGILNFYKYSSTIKDFYQVGWSESLEANAERYSLALVRASAGPLLVYGVIHITSGPLDAVGQIKSLNTRGLKFREPMDPVTFNKLSVKERMEVFRSQEIVFESQQKQLIHPGLGDEDKAIRNIDVMGKFVPADIDGDGKDELFVFEDEKSYLLIESAER